MSITLSTRTRDELTTRAKIVAGDSEETTSSLWTTTEAQYAMDAAYREVAAHLVHRRHPACRYVHYENSAITNPVCTLSWGTESGADIEAVHVSDSGADLSSVDTDMYVLKPRDWQFMSTKLYGNAALSDPEFYILLSGGSASLELWMAAPPDTAGTNSVRIISYGIQDWAAATATICPLPHIYDQLIINKGAIFMRMAKDMELGDLVGLNSSLEGRMLQTTAEPRQEQDYSFGIAGRSSLSFAKHGINSGRIRRS